MTASETASRHVRHLDTAGLAATEAGKRFSQRLIDATSGGAACAVIYVRTPAGEGSPSGDHIHDVDQLFFVLEGTMGADIDGDVVEALPGDLVVIPAGVPHRNWNGGSTPSLHLEIKAPAPDPSLPGSRPAAH